MIKTCLVCNGAILSNDGACEHCADRWQHAGLRLSGKIAPTSKAPIECVLDELYCLREELDLQQVVEYDDGNETIGEIIARAIVSAHEVKEGAE